MKPTIGHMEAVGEGAEYALRFISGRYEGGEFPLYPNREIVIGRQSDLELVLVEDMVSRRHARLLTDGGRLIIEDLGSTNGTFVNGERVRRARLKEGDRLLVGTSIMKVVALHGAPMSEEQSRVTLHQAAQQRAHDTGQPMAGTLDDIPVPDLLQLLSSSKRTGHLQVRTLEGVGHVWLRKGQLVRTRIDGGPEAARKVVFRLLRWNAGRFEFTPENVEQDPQRAPEPTQDLVAEGLEQLDELARIEGEAPRPTEMLELCNPVPRPLRQLDPEHLDVLQLIHNWGQVQIVTDKSELTDLETFQIMLDLLDHEYVRAKEG